LITILKMKNYFKTILMRIKNIYFDWLLSD
jgi:hypothetical protein